MVGRGVYSGLKSRHQRPHTTKVSGCMAERKARLLQAEEVGVSVWMLQWGTGCDLRS